MRHPYIPRYCSTVIRFLVATCPANGTGPREAPLITASGEGFIYHSTLTPPGAFSSSYTAHTRQQGNTAHPIHLHTSVTVQQRQKLPGYATLLEALSLCRALPSTKGGWFHPYHQRSCQPRYVFPSPYHTVAPGPPMPSSASSLGHGPADSC